jgi:hypothetical protein
MSDYLHNDYVPNLLERTKRAWIPVFRRNAPVALWGVTVFSALWWLVQPSYATVVKKLSPPEK